jgi:ABC-type bacteriocin/lantibiotic exporter with double-glycine peptidase domain
VSRDGSTALNIIKAAQGYGLEYKAYWYNTDKVQEKANFPAILFWNRSHFVVLNGIKKGYFYINDPESGFIRLSREDFNETV